MSNRKNLSKMKNQSPKKYDPVEINELLLVYNDLY